MRENMDTVRPGDVEELTEFTAFVGPYRAELLAHCARMLGGRDDAEDMVQETLLRAWRAYGDFEGRSSVRTWLYRIATNVCLTALERRGRLPLPSGLPEAAFAEESDWPAERLRGGGPAGDEDPATILGVREESKRALLVAWRHLTARQRAVLVLSEVLTWQASEIADLLGMSASAVYSMLRRARAELASARGDGAQSEEMTPDSADERRTLEQYARSIEDGDVSMLVTLLAEDAVCDRPSVDRVVSGTEEIGRFIAQCPAFGRCRMMSITVDGQPGFAVYRRDADGVYRLNGIDVLAVSADGIRRVEVLEDRTMLAGLNLPATLA
jgi:RNA polymerase sigma-70 factor (ECF subfamily)